jgi:hypothetical protein
VEEAAGGMRGRGMTRREGGSGFTILGFTQDGLVGTSFLIFIRHFICITHLLLLLQSFLCVLLFFLDNTISDCKIKRQGILQQMTRIAYTNLLNTKGLIVTPVKLIYYLCNEINASIKHNK